MPGIGRRVLIVGNPGTGKSWLATRLSEHLDLPYIEVDELFWGPNWTKTPEPQLRELVSEATSSERWVFAGDFSFIEDITWPRSETVIFLDYSIPVVVGRLLRRSYRRRRGQEFAPAGNTERWWRYFHPRRSAIRPALRVKNGVRRLFAEKQADPRLSHVQFLRFRSPTETDRWLHALLQPQPMRVPPGYRADGARSGARLGY